MISLISSSSFLGAVPSPDAFIHCCKGPPQRQGEKTDQDMSLGPVFLLMEDRSHPQIMFCGAEGIFNLGKLDIGVPEDLWIGLCPVGTEDVAASGFQCPLVALFVLS